MRRQWTLKQLLWITVFVTGLPLWLISYELLSFTAVRWLVLGVLALLAAFFMWRTKQPVLKTTMVTVGGYMIAYCFKIVVDTALDPTSHNLLPFELVMVAMLAFIASFLGSLLGLGARKAIN